MTKHELLMGYSVSIVSRGEQILKSGRILEYREYIDEEEYLDEIFLTALVEGSRPTPYHVNFTIDEEEGTAYGVCDCPYGRRCKHMAAVLLHYWQEKNGARATKTSRGLSSALARYKNAVEPGVVRLEPQLQFAGRNRFLVSCTIGISRMYIVKDLAELVQNVTQGRTHAYGKNLSMVHGFEMFDEESLRIFRILSRCVDLQSTYLPADERKYARLDQSSLSELLSLYIGREIKIKDRPFRVTEGDPPINISVKERLGEGAELTIPQFLLAANTDTPWLIRNHTFYHCTPAFSYDTILFLEDVGCLSGMVGTRKEVLRQSDYEAFCGDLLPRIEKNITLELGTLDLSEYMPKEPLFRFYLTTGSNDNILLRPTVSYGTAEYPLLEQGQEYRRMNLERPVRTMLDTWFVPEENRIWLTTQNDAQIYDLLMTGLDQLREVGEVFTDDNWKPLHTTQHKVKVGVSLEGNLIDLNVQVEGMPPEEIARILGAYKKKKKFYRLPDGAFLSLEGGNLAVISDLCDGLRLSGKDLLQGIVSVPAFRAQYINTLFEEEGGQLQIERSLAFRRHIRNLKQYQDSEYTVPKSIHASLRPYQEVGYSWLRTLTDCGLGGILADDMGLGKTLQVITLLASCEGTALIVCPASLLYNWESELHRFAPELSVTVVTGTAGERREKRQEAGRILVTSYDLLKRDIKDYKEQQFAFCILDEAQYIRNAGTQAAKAAKLVRADHRFALTGTPIENRLSDLWSIFDFLMPGFLYPYETFRKELEAPIVGGDEAASARLRRMVGSFLLRRKKEDVLKELPDKVESIQYVELSPKQRELYLAQEQQLRQSLLKEENNIDYLAALTRLRQICCSPSLYLEDFPGESAKEELCLDLLAESAAEGHKTLVFSQFTTMLDRLAEGAGKRNLTYFYLSGKTNKEQRRDLTAAFQRGEATVFFISLKAGGTGLNLTAADRVIHFDPWWNYAAEEQATDRTHRIGQKNTVFVTKLVAKDTVEERIIALQEAKKHLSEQVVTGDGVSDGRLSKEAVLALLNEV